MRKIIAFILPLFIMACEWDMPTAGSENVYVEPKVIYTGNNLSGTGNAVVFNNQIHFLVAYDAKVDAVAGYPDKGVFWHKLKLVSETNPSVAMLEANPVVDYPHLTDIAITPDQKISMVYRSPTGASYGFRMPNVIWDGQKLSSSSVFTNENFGLYPRISYRADNTPVIISFSAAGYFLVYHSLINGNWGWQQISNFGEWQGDIQTIYANNTLYIGNMLTTTNPFQLKVLAIGADNIVKTVDSGTTITNFCDITYFNGNFQTLFVKDDLLMLGAKGTFEIVATKAANIGYRATILYDGNIATVAYQTDKEMIVLRKQGSEWKTIFNHKLSLSANILGWTRGPSLVMKNGLMNVVYNDNSNVYLKTL